MRWTIIKTGGDGSHWAREGEVQSSSQRDEWLRTVPRPVPTTHIVRIRWVADFKFIIECVPKSQVEAETKAATAEAGKPAPEAPSGTIGEWELKRVELAGKNDADLQTIAAENGIDLSKLPKKPSKAQVVAAILDGLKGKGAKNE